MKNEHLATMTVRQKILKRLYPVFQKLNGLIKEKGVLRPGKDAHKPASGSFYQLKAVLSNGTDFDFQALREKKVLLVNVASDCGFTPQYTELEKLYQLHKDKLVILGFPSNNFQGQEPGGNQEIEQFCKINYGVSFPLFQKLAVLGPEQHPVFKWLSQKSLNGWNEQAPSWNFCKFLIDENGTLQAVFQPHVSPLSREMMQAIVKGES